MDKNPITYEEYIAWLDTFLRKVSAEFVKYLIECSRPNAGKGSC